MTQFHTRVRPAVSGDAEQMSILLNAIIAVGGTTAHQTPFETERMRRHYIAGAQVVSCQVAISNGRLSGFQYLGQDKAREGWAIIATFVAIDRAKLGIGQRLFSATRSFARAARVRTIDATIRADNLGGLKYYSGLGFQDYAVLKQVPLADGTPVDHIRKRLDL